MSESANTIIKYFCDRFLDIEYYPSNLKAILDFDLHKIKNIKKEDLLKFQKFNIKTFRDLCNLDQSDYDRLINHSFIEKNLLNNIIIAATLIANSWNKRSIYLNKPKMKVVVAGLDFAGKTSLINRLIHDYNYNDMNNIEPTIGTNIEEYHSKWLNLILWDLGGQKDNINEYLESPEKFFVQLDVLIFVIDAQDDNRYNEAVRYLNDLIEIFTFLNENPYILVLINKVDSDIAEDPDFQIKLEYLMDKITNIFINSQKSWNFELIPTSIYNFYSSEPEIAKSIKKIFTKEKSETHLDTITEINEKLERILNINLELMDKIVSDFSKIKQTLFRFTHSNVSQSLFNIPIQDVPCKNSFDKQKTNQKDRTKKKESKKKELKKRERIKKVIGPPKRLESIISPNEITQNIKNNHKITEEKLKEIKNDLTPTPKSSDLRSTPPIAPKKGYLSKADLKPPPPPPKIAIKNDTSLQGNRKQIISELKELFIRRGLVPHKNI
ncbi:MAG: ADP-ribosylation factor-like protein [Promethearchaeota archaeon]